MLQFYLCKYLGLMIRTPFKKIFKFFWKFLSKFFLSWTFYFRSPKLIARYQNLYFSTNGVNFFSNFQKIKVFWFLLFLNEYAMNQKNFGSFVVCLTSTNFGEVRSKFSHNSRTLMYKGYGLKSIRSILSNFSVKEVP